MSKDLAPSPSPTDTEEVGAETKTCFVIGPIGAPASVERRRADDVFDFIVAPCAGEHHLTATRADKIDESGFITNQIIDLLMEADVVVADFWSLNPNVFYELGVRHAFGRPVIHLYQEPPPFDVAPMRGIPLDHTDLRSVDAARTSVSNQMKDMLRKEYVQASPVSAWRDFKKLATGSDLEKTVAELASQVESLQRAERERAASAARYLTPPTFTLNYDEPGAKTVFPITNVPQFLFANPPPQIEMTPELLDRLKILRNKPAATRRAVKPPVPKET